MSFTSIFEPATITYVAGTAAALGAAGAVKLASRKAGKAIHKILSPLAALIVGVTAAAIGGDQAVELAEKGAAIAVTAIGVHSTWKNATQVAKTKG